MGGLKIQICSSQLPKSRFPTKTLRSHFLMGDYHIDDAWSVSALENDRIVLLIGREAI